MCPTIPLALAPALIAAGCGSGSGSDPGAAIAGAPAANPARAAIICDAAVWNPDLAAARQAATTVVLFKPTGVRTVRRLGGVPFTISTVAVLLHLSGERARPLFGLRQTGSPGLEREERAHRSSQSAICIWPS